MRWVFQHSISRDNTIPVVWVKRHNDEEPLAHETHHIQELLAGGISLPEMIFNNLFPVKTLTASLAISISTIDIILFVYAYGVEVILSPEHTFTIIVQILATMNLLIAAHLATARVIYRINPLEQTARNAQKPSKK